MTLNRIIGGILVLIIPIHVFYNFEKSIQNKEILAFGLIFVIFFASLYTAIFDHLPIKLNDKKKQLENDLKINSPFKSLIAYFLNLLLVIGLFILMLGLIQNALAEAIL